MEKTTDGQRNIELLAQVREGKSEALGELVERNMGLVKSIARRYKDRGTEYEDLVQIGAIGMIKAANSFDFSYGTTFSTYAVPLIAGEIRRHLRDDGPLKVSRTLRKLGADALREREKFQNANGREPRISELAAAMCCSEEELTEALEAVFPVRSIYEPAGRTQDGMLLDLLPETDGALERLTDRLSLQAALRTLGDFQREIVFLRYYRDLSQEETGRILGVSQVKVSREEKKIIARLRQLL